MYNSTNIAERIKAVAKKQNVSLKKMFEDIGMGFNTMSNMKTSIPKADNLAKIADYLDVSVDYLLGREDNANKNLNIDYYDFYLSIFGKKGIETIKKQLIPLINAYGKLKLADDLNVEFADIEQFLIPGKKYGYKVWEKFDTLLILLEVNTTNLILTSTISES